VDGLLDELRVARVAADPAPVAGAGEPGGLTCYRLHGSPRIYYSADSSETLVKMAERLASDTAAGVETWCIFDNIAAFAATGDAITIKRLVQSGCRE
jgi:uncharacterized protein YecE (DUF72 family)